MDTRSTSSPRLAAIALLALFTASVGREPRPRPAAGPALATASVTPLGLPLGWDGASPSAAGGGRCSGDGGQEAATSGHAIHRRLRRCVATPTPTPAPAGGLFTLVKSVQVTPAANRLQADFVRIGYAPERDRMIVAFRTRLDHEEGNCTGHADAYREYTVDMDEAGVDTVFSCYADGDVGFLVGNELFLANTSHEGAGDGWRLVTYHVATGTVVASEFLPLDTEFSGTRDPGDPIEDAADPTLVFVNGQLDVGSQYRQDPTAPPGPFESFATTTSS